ncbi:nodulation protein S (NodS) [Sphingomonas sp. PP-F2F-G114-C0414]|uniref:class I SAM-dependent DNA methyltransferase n=1 Tax=Sphingomonas sp. PP-F2F-G114-C0414 TaxID=2135662 RepID=UPI000EF88169|nr:SAM-dependent methyltransferase [Sphingomonas sp. PP-F2F-G114-C0414]RMB26276.1 nodulation protein S (NodS) [Sphingomonas sp. PP-F2F-G114-C0414]
MRREHSIEPAYFEALYKDRGDPWHFETSAYEAAKYDATLAALPGDRFGSALEVGCANGVLTTRLAQRCDSLLAVDVSDTALTAARARCGEQSNVRVERRRLPAEAPDGAFDLVLLSEVVYYWDSADISRLADYLRTAVLPGGHILLVHWIGETDYPKSGDDAVAELKVALGEAVTVVRSDRYDAYRLDLWRFGAAG